MISNNSWDLIVNKQTNKWWSMTFKHQNLSNTHTPTLQVTISSCGHPPDPFWDTHGYTRYHNLEHHFSAKYRPTKNIAIGNLETKWIKMGETSFVYWYTFIWYIYIYMYVYMYTLCIIDRYVYHDGRTCLPVLFTLAISTSPTPMPRQRRSGSAGATPLG